MEIRSFDDFMDSITPDDAGTREFYLKNLDRYKDIIDRSPDKFLNQHLNTAVEKEEFEIAAYTRDVIAGRKDGSLKEK